MIRKLPSGEYRLYSGSKNPKTGKRRNLGTFPVVREAVAAGRLAVHGMHFDFRDCELRILGADGRFVPARDRD